MKAASESGTRVRAQTTEQPKSQLPSERQKKFAEDIFEKLADTISAKDLELAVSNREHCNKFIDRHKKAFDARVEAEKKQKEKATLDLFHKKLNEIGCITPQLRTELNAAATPKDKLDAVKKHKLAGGGFTRIDPKSLHSTAEKLIAYWLDGLLSTAFDNMAKLENLIGDPQSSFAVDKIESLLAGQLRDELKFDQLQPPVRHLLLKLEDHRPQQKKEALVLSALPLMAVQDPNDARGYRWVPTPERVPLFNRNHLGEAEKKWPGLMLDQVDAYDAWAHEQQEKAAQSIGQEAGTNADLSEALAIWDEAFDILSGADLSHPGVKGWIERFVATRKEFWQIKNRRPVFALVDNGAAGGASVHVCNAYRQLLIEPDWIKTEALALFRRIADTQALQPEIYDPEQHGYDSGHITSYFGHMDSLKNGKREAFPLDPAQRDALIAMELTGDGNLLAVNGPPGTGKTSLLRGVIASRWIAPLLGDETEPDCPLILACAATNQAVTNIISSFDETPGPRLFSDDGNLLDQIPVGTDSRWLPQLVSYGWFAPPRIKEEVLRDYGKFQLVGRDSPHAPWKFNGIVEPFNKWSDTQLEDAYLSCAGRHFGIQLDLASVLQRLREKVKTDKKNIEALKRSLDEWIDGLRNLAATATWTDTHRSERRQLRVRSEILTGSSDTRQRLQEKIVELDDKLAGLARFNDFSMPQECYDTLLKTLPADDPLRTETDYDAIRQQYEDVSELAAKLAETRRFDFVRLMTEAFSSVFQPENAENRWNALRGAMHACGIPADGGKPDAAAWSEAATKRKAVLGTRLEATAAEAIRIYLRRQGVALTPAADFRTIWPDELDAHRETLLNKRATLVAGLKEIDEELAANEQELARLEQVRTEFAQALAHARKARAAIVSCEAKLGGRLPKNTHRLKAMNKCLATAAKEGLTEAGILQHRFDANRHIQDWLDIHVRTSSFHYCARYWEGRYILLRKTAAARLKSDQTYTMASAEQLRHLAMLAPVFVVTAYSAPKLMRRNLHGLEENVPPYLFGEADLLIVDEAGQGTPEIGASAFMFARKSIVVGDVAQLEPVWSMEETTDKSLVARFGLGQVPTEEKQTPYEALAPSGVLLARGSVMRMAQRATGLINPKFPQMPGLTLTNHYRCLAPIIEICNRMVYKGALQVATPAPDKLWRPELSRLGFLVTEEVADTKNPGGSRRNPKEAQCIARWLHENEASLVKHYSKKKPAAIENLIAIITPFKGQIPELKKAIAEEYGIKFDPADKDAIYNKITIDTVHSLQGAEKQVVIFAMVDTNDPGGPQFYDKGSNLINVAISRAKEMFIVAMTQKAVDYARLLDEKSPGKPSNYLWQPVVAHGTRLNSRRVIVVESPNKCEAIRKALGLSIELEVLATEGHIAELEKPQRWNALADPQPTWSAISNTALKMFEKIGVLWPDLESLYLATDPDPEGEAIAWHVLRVLEERRKRGDIPAIDTRMPKIKRMRFYNLQAEEMNRAYGEASDGLDGGLVKSAIVRSLLDHLITTRYAARIGIGNANDFTRGIGRVQLGILDLVHRANRQEPNYALKVTMPLADGSSGLTTFAAVRDPAGTEKFSRTKDGKAAAAAVPQMLSRLKQPQLGISIKWERDPLQQHPPYPGLNTARLLALAWRSKGMPPARAMAALQALYEGSTEMPSDPATSKSLGKPLDEPHRSSLPLET